MKLKNGEWGIFVLNLIYITGFTIYYILTQKHEFLFYTFILLFFVIVFLFILRKIKLPYYTLWGLTFLGFLHMLGGTVIMNGHVIYYLKIIGVVNVGTTTILRFDQVVHFYGSGVIVLTIHHLFKPIIKFKKGNIPVYAAIVLISMGFGSLNEIAEFIATLILPESNVGDYNNTLLDMVFNLLGSIVAVFFAIYALEKDLPEKSESK